MSRAARVRSDGPGERGSPQASLETMLALCLCAVVLVSSLAFMRSSRSLARGGESLEASPSALRQAPPGPSEAGQTRPELLILISLDTLRADRLDLYGYPRQTAPALHALGRESSVFATVVAQSSQTLTSHKSLLTGKYPSTLMFEQTGADTLTLASLESPREYLVNVFSTVRGTLAESLAESGYRCAAFTDGAWMGRETGFDHGFELFDASGGGLEAILPRALSWLATTPGGPRFLFLHAYDVHCPYPCRSPFNNSFCPDCSGHLALEEACGKGALYGAELSSADLRAINDHYDGGIRSADEHLGRFLDELRARGLYERALIVVTSDHGESLGERGQVGHGGLSLEELLVPLILKFPSGWEIPPARVAEPVELVDLLPTLITACGGDPARDLDGRSLLPILVRGVRGKEYLLSQTTFEEAPELASNPSKRSLLKPGRWQVVNDPRSGTGLFYSLEHDAHALAGIPVRGPEFPAFLEILLGDGRRARGAPRRPGAPVRFSAELERELAALGYGSR
jgi:arylsulfatase